jgi:hypothetical protein
MKRAIEKFSQEEICSNLTVSVAGVEEIIIWKDLTKLVDKRLADLEKNLFAAIDGSSHENVSIAGNSRNSDDAAAVVKRRPHIRRKANEKPGPAADIHNHPEDGNTTSTEKLQTLLLQQRDMTAQEMDTEKSKHRVLTEEMAELTSLLMEATLNMQSTVSQQNLV